MKSQHVGHIVWSWLILWSCCSHAAFMNTVQSFTLDNGLRILVKEDHRAPVVMTQIWYRVGGSDEIRGMTGVSHILEHMMFKGTEAHPGQTFNRLIGENGGKLNAATSQDATFYYEELAAGKLGLALWLEADRMRNLTMKQADFEKELEVVKEERRLRVDDSPMGKTYERFLAAAHISSPYHHPVIGWAGDIEQMRLADLQHWYDRWYAPNNASVIVVGDVTAKQVFQIARKYFGPLKAIEQPNDLHVKKSEEQPPVGLRTLQVKTPAQVPWIVMGYHVPSLKTAKQAWEPHALSLAAIILSGGYSARLPKDVMRGKRLASQVSAEYDPYRRLDTLFELQGTPIGPAAGLQQALLDAIKNLRINLVSAAELERAKTRYIATFTYSQDSLATQASIIGQLETIGLPWKTLSNAIDTIQRITPEQIRDVAQRYLIEDHLTIATLIPQSINGVAS